MSDKKGKGAEEGPVEEVLDEEKGSLLSHMIGQLKIGMDLSKVTLPTFLLEPRSFLEKLTDFMSHPNLLLSSTSEDDEVERMLCIARWFLSGWHVRPKGVKKPYNPVLGETFICEWDHGDDGITTFLSEQVSHHPPVSALFVENRKKGLVVNGHIYPRSKFLGNKAASIMEGEIRVTLLNHDKEEYILTWPTVYARGILFGQLGMELGEKTYIECKKTGLRCDFHFKTKGMFGGDFNSVVGSLSKQGTKKPLYTFDGHWDDVMYILPNGDKKAKELFIDVTKEKIAEKIVIPQEEQGPFESRRLWSRVTAALSKKDVDAATEAKTRNEEAQRAGVRERKEKSKEWKLKYFKQKGKTYEFHDVNWEPADGKDARNFSVVPLHEDSPFGKGMDPDW